MCHGKACRRLNAVGAVLFDHFHGFRSREDAARGDDRNRQPFFREISLHLAHDGGQRMQCPVHAEPQMPARKRSLDHDVVRKPSRRFSFSQEKVQRSVGRNNDAEKSVVKALIFLHEPEA